MPHGPWAPGPGPKIALAWAMVPAKAILGPWLGPMAHGRDVWPMGMSYMSYVRDMPSVLCPMALPYVQCPVPCPEVVPCPTALSYAPWPCPHWARPNGIGMLLWGAQAYPFRYVDDNAVCRVTQIAIVQPHCAHTFHASSNDSSHIQAKSDTSLAHGT